MPAELRIAVGTLPQPSLPGVSKTAQQQVSLSFKGLNVSEADLWLVYGKASSPPATFAGFANPVTLRLTPDLWQRVSFGNSSGAINGNAAGTLGAMAVPAWTAYEDTVYFGLFDVSPVSSSVPLAVAGPLDVIT